MLVFFSTYIICGILNYIFWTLTNTKEFSIIFDNINTWFEYEDIEYDILKSTNLLEVDLIYKYIMLIILFPFLFFIKMFIYSFCVKIIEKKIYLQYPSKNKDVIIRYIANNYNDYRKFDKKYYNLPKKKVDNLYILLNNLTDYELKDLCLCKKNKNSYINEIVYYHYEKK